MTPAWILDIFAALMLMVAAVSAARLVAARPWQRGAVITDTDISHLLMAIAMAGMLAPSLTTLPSGAWEVIFGLMIAWFAYRVLRDARANGVRALAGGHCAPHLVHSGAMLFMFAAVSAAAAGGGSGVSGMGGSSGTAMQTLSYPTLTFLFALVLIGYAIWDLDQLSGLRHGGTAAVAGAPGAALAVPAMTGAGGTTASFAAPAAEAGASPDSRSSSVGGQAAAGAAAAGGRSALDQTLLSPGVTVGCRIAMGVTMAVMLIIMI
jgi:hypothetical protein